MCQEGYKVYSDVCKSKVISDSDLNLGCNKLNDLEGTNYFP